MEDKVRIRLTFDSAPELTTLPDQRAIKTFMFLINKKDCSQVCDVEKKISEKFHLLSSSSVTLFIDGFALMSSEDVDVIRDDDEVMVINDIAKINEFIKAKHNLNHKSVERSKSKELKKLKNKSKTEITPLNSTASQLSLVDKNVQNIVSKNLENSEKLKKHKKSKRKKYEDTKSTHVAETKIDSPPKKKSRKSKVEKKDRISTLENQDISCLGNTMQTTDEAGMVTPESLLDFDFKDNHQFPQAFLSSSSSPKKKKHKHSSKKANSSNTNGFSDRVSSTKNYDLMLSLSWPPRNGDLIAFKLLEMAEDYSPIISSFQEGVVLELDGTAPENASITLEMLSGLAKMKRSGRFELDLDDELDEKVRTISWSRLIDPKLVKE